MRDSSPGTDALRHAVAAILGLRNQQGVSLSRVPSRTRNAVFRLTKPVSAYVKVFLNDAAGINRMREKSALTALAGLIPAPTVLGDSEGAFSVPPFLILSARPGKPLGHLLQNASRQEARFVFAQIDMTLARLSSDSRLANTLEQLPYRLTGAHMADFSPAAWISRHAPHLHPLVADLPPLEKTLLHGSVDCGNILVRRRGGRFELSALIDFEGCRLGPAGFDQAKLWYDLKVGGFHAAAEEWLKLIRDRGTLSSLAGFVTNVAWLLAVRMRRTGKESHENRLIRGEIVLILEKLASRFALIRKVN